MGEGNPDDIYDVPAAEFDRQLATIASFGATPVTLDELFDGRRGGGRLPERSVVLTFDDGRACQHRVAMPLLVAHHMVAESFVVAGRIGEDDAHRYIERDDFGEHPFLIFPEVAQMVNSGAFRIESHSLTHRRHTDLSSQERGVELTESRRVLRERVGAPVNFFAYPYGGFDSAYRDEVERAGYRGALTVGKGPGSRFAMLRISVRRDSGEAVAKGLSRAFGPTLR